MPTERPTPPVERLSLTREEQWTLHGVLLVRVREREAGEDGRARDDLRDAFEALDAGRQRFTHAELAAMQRALSRAHHTRRWEVERSRLEALLRQTSAALATAAEEPEDQTERTGWDA